MSAQPLREVWFEECAGVHAVIASRERHRFEDGVWIIPPAEHEVVLAYPLDDQQQCLAWEALVRVPQDLLRASMQLVGLGFALRCGVVNRAP